MAVARIVLCLLLGYLSHPFMPAQPESRSKIPELYRRWLDEEVVYIITAKEREVFEKLQTDRERDIFVAAFWKQRDPTPGTPANEFRDEHYRRWHYANEYFSRSTPRPGWMTDMGRIHIILGPPKTIENHANVNGVFPVEIWTYEGDPEYGLPPGFRIIFFKRNGTGEYIFYSPSADGPESLIADWGTGLTQDYLREGRNPQTAYKQLLRLAPGLAYQTLSLIPGEIVMEGAASMASLKLLGNVLAYPQKKVQDRYAEALLKYKDVIEVDYTANYVPGDSSLQIIRDEAGFYMVHYSIEPRKISVDSYGGAFSVNYELDGRISDLAGQTVYQYRKDIPVTFRPEEFKDLAAKSLAVQDLFPLVPGTYKFDLLVKNTVSREFTTFEWTLAIPEESALPSISSLLLGYQLEKSGPAASEFIPFKIKDGQMLVPARKTFAQKEDLVVYFQVLGLPPALQASAELRVDILRRDAPFRSQTKKLGGRGAGGALDVLETMPLRDLPPDYYKIKVSVLDPSGAVFLSRAEDFEISPAPAIGRPIVVSKVMTDSGRGEYDCELGLQLLNLTKNVEALVYLEKAYAWNPAQIKYALGLSQCLFMEGQYRKVKDILTPFREEKEPALVLYFLGKSVHSLGELDEAISDYGDYLSRFGMNLEILNLLGTAHYQKGNAAEALRAWQRSLEINPGQENIRKLVQSLQNPPPR
ncbi:MAG: GWxTD domain-containing protein [Acidobacteriota bacterium]|nr:GWxTD domain-containing protein [Acidobacteriota bacterium]